MIIKDLERAIQDTEDNGNIPLGVVGTAGILLCWEHLMILRG